MSQSYQKSRRSTRTTIRAAIDALEPRRMMALYDGSDGLTDGPDTVLITTAAQFHRVTINGTAHTTGDLTVTINTLGGNDTINVTDTLTGSIVVVNGGNGDDFLQNIGRDLDDTYASFLFAGGAGVDRIVADNSGDDDSARTFRIEADRLVREESPERILLTYSGLEVFGYADTEFANTIRLANLQTASRDVQQLQVLGNGGNDFIRNDTSQYWGTTFGTGLAQIVGGPGNDVVDLFNTNATVPATYTMDATSLDVSSTQFNTGPVTFASCESVTVEGSAQDETFLLNGKPAGLNIKFNGNNGNDAFTVGGGDLDSGGWLTANPVTNVAGGAGTDSITFDDHLDAEGEVEGYSLLYSNFNLSSQLFKGALGFQCFGVEVQTLDAADRVNSVNTPCQVNIFATDPATISTTINGGANRRCEVSVGGVTPAGINGTINANLQGGTLGISSLNTPFVYRLTQTQLVEPKLINYSGADAFNFIGSDEGDTFFIDGVPSGMAVSINGRFAEDEVFLGTGDVDATILGPVTFSGEDGIPDRITIDNSQDMTLESHVLNGATFTDGQTHTLNTDQLIINGGPGGTNFAVNATSCQTIINGGAGNDFFNVGGGDINSNIHQRGASTPALTMGGFGGTDAIVFNDLNDTTLDPFLFFRHLGTESLLKSAPAASDSQLLYWTDIESVTLDASNNPTFAGDANVIDVTTSDTPLRIRGNAGTDRIIIKDATVPVLVHTGAGDADQLIVNSDAGPGDEPVVVVVDQTDDLEVLDIKQGGTVRVEPNAVLVKTRLNATPGILSIAGVLDLAGGALLSTAGGPSQAVFRAMLSDGYNSGTWNGTSTGGAINSSLAAASASGDGVGYGLGSQITPTSIGPFTIAAGDTLLRYALNGDADLNAIVDIADFARLGANFNGVNKVWTTGDFNYDNSTNIGDFAALAANFNQSVASGIPRPASSSPRFSARLIDEIL